MNSLLLVLSSFSIKKKKEEKFRNRIFHSFDIKDLTSKTFIPHYTPVFPFHHKNISFYVVSPLILSRALKLISLITLRLNDDYYLEQ